MRERGELPMEHQNLNQEQKLRVALCGPLPKTERTLLRRGDVEIIRDDDNFNLLMGMFNGKTGCDLMIVEAPYGHGLHSMTCQVGEHKTCPLWLVNDPPDEAIWYKINLQLDEVPAKRKAALEQAIAVGPPRHEILILADTPERRGELTGWMKKIYSVWNVTLPPLIVPEDVKAYLRELRGPCAPPEAVVIAMAGVDSLKAAEHIRRVWPKVGMVWSCNLDFSLQAYHLNVDCFFLLGEANTGTLGIGLNRIYQYNKRGSEQ